MRILKLSFLLFLLPQFSYSSPIIYKGEKQITYFGKSISILEDKTNKLTLPQVLNSASFEQSKEEVPNLGISSSSFWIKFTVKNLSEKDLLLFHLSYPLLDVVEFYSPLPEGGFKVERTGDRKKFSERSYNHQNFIFTLTIPRTKNYTYYLKIESGEQIMLPLSIGAPESIVESLLHKDIFFAIFFGIIAVMILYNLFLYFIIRDKAYIYYVLYVFCVGFTQLTLEGYTFKYLWPDFPDFVNSSVTIFPSIAGIFIVIFMSNFLQTRIYLPLFSKISIFFIISYSFAIALSFLGFVSLSYRFVDFSAVFTVLILWGIGSIAKKGYRPAKFIFVGWTIAICGFTLFSLRNFGILPYSNFSNYTMMAGIAFEVIVFSIALADRINILKKENDLKQEVIIKHLKANEDHLKITQELAINSEKLKKEILSSEYESLKNQVNPHFLFNSLNVLTELVYRNQDEAAQFVKELSDIYRYVLDNKNKEVVSIEAELNFIKSFTYLLKIRYGKNFHVIIKNNFDEECRIVPLSLQLLVENCIKHNIVSKEDPLTIKIYKEDQYLVVSNNLQMKEGMPESSKIGLKNIQERYLYLSDRPVVIIKNEENFIVKIPLLIVELN